MKDAKNRLEIYDPCVLKDIKYEYHDKTGSFRI